MRYKTKPVVVRELFDAKTCETIIQFMDEWIPLMLLDNDLNEPDSFHKFGRRCAGNIGPFREIHGQLSEFASELFGEKVKPSYSFLSLYAKYGNCPLHLDRPQCRYTIDYLIRQEQSSPWPISIGPQMTDSELNKVVNRTPDTQLERQAVIDSTNWTTINLNPNEAVCYSGTNAWHYRPEASQGSVDLVFFHFVPEGFRGSLD